MKLTLAVLAAALDVSAAKNDNVADVPGCNCEASMCKSDNSTVEACALLTNFRNTMRMMSDPPYDFWGSIGDETEPICDALLNSDDFQDTYPDNGAYQIYHYSDGRESRGPYYRSAPLPVTLFSGTCDDSIKEQLSCKSGDNEGRRDDPFPVQREYQHRENSTLLSSIDYYGVNPSSCLVGVDGLPGTISTLRWSLSCASYYDESIVTGYDDQLSLFVETDGYADFSPCDGEVVPVLSSRDWIEPAEGRRYMCYEFVDPKDSSATYSLLTMSLGNEPCHGPMPTEPDTISVGSVHMSRGFGLLVTLVITLIRL